jgi:uncharacterized membrane protein YjfL (UPF0719 family)
MAGDKQIEYPSSTLVKYLKVAAAAMSVAGVLLDVAVPIAQQIGKKKPAKEGLEGAIRLSVVLALVRGIPRLVGAVRTLRGQLSTQVVR